MRFFTHKDVKIACIASALPKQRLDINGKNLAFAAEEQTTCDLGFEAAQKILTSCNVEPHEIGALIFLTKTPDYRGPATAMVLQNRLQIPQDCIVYDAPSGNGGFEQALNLGATLLGTTHQKFMLVVLGDTISKQLSKDDLLQFNFQDGASAILLERQTQATPITIGIQTVNELWSDFMVPSGGFRNVPEFFDVLPAKRSNQLAEHLHLNIERMQEVLKPIWSGLKSDIVNTIAPYLGDNFALYVNLLLPGLEQDFKKVWCESELCNIQLNLHSELIPQTMGATLPMLLVEKNVLHENQTDWIISLSIGEGVSLNMACFQTKEILFLETFKTDYFFDNGHVTHEM
jgi:3-oxoacyl-[acyl-carrier-protein] synthase-3